MQENIGGTTYFFTDEQHQAAGAQGAYEQGPQTGVVSELFDWICCQPLPGFTVQGLTLSKPTMQENIVTLMSKALQLEWYVRFYLPVHIMKKPTMTREVPSVKDRAILQQTCHPKSL